MADNKHSSKISKPHIGAGAKTDAALANITIVLVVVVFLPKLSVTKIPFNNFKLHLDF